jgi:hypothetical protein
MVGVFVTTIELINKSKFILNTSDMTDIFNKKGGRAIAQAVRPRILTAVTPVRTQISSFRICGGQSGSGKGLSWVFPCQYHSTAAPY